VDIRYLSTEQYPRCSGGRWHNENYHETAGVNNREELLLERILRSEEVVLRNGGTVEPI
jgi:hypothetical protein